MDFVKSHLEKMKLWPVEHFLLTFFQISTDLHWPGKKVSQKCSTGQSFIFSQWLLQNPYFNLFCTIADPFSGLSKPDPWGNSKAAELSWCSAQLVHYGRNCKILLEKLQGIFFISGLIHQSIWNWGSFFECTVMT